VVYVTSAGYRDIASKTPISEDTIFAIASMTKPVTCIGAMMLVEQGKLALEDPVEKYLPELKGLRVLADPKNDTDDEPATVPAKRPITIRDLFTHTSGIGYGFPVLGDTSQTRLEKVYTRARLIRGNLRTITELVEQLGKVPLAHQPGDRWTYGLNHDVLGRVIEVVSGDSFADYLQKHILNPLDMRDTAFLVPVPKRDRVATIYRAGLNGELVPVPKNYGSATLFSGGGGLFSTMRDYSRFAQMLLNKGEFEGQRLVKRETIEQMTTNQIGSLSAFGVLKYGLGFGLIPEPTFLPKKKPALSRYFWGGIYSTNFSIDPHQDLLTIIMTQVLPTNHGGAERALNAVVGSAIVK
jgi:CubicO group peptidase (beta-lactamase class C family)